MSNALAIATVTAMLQDLLQSALVSAPASEQVMGADVNSGFPRADASGQLNRPRLNIYLYQVTPNPAFLNSDLPTRPGAVALNLHYLLTFSGSEDTWEPQRLLGIAVRALAGGATLSRAAIRQFLERIPRNDDRAFLKGSDLASGVELVKITPMQMSLEEMTKLWSVFFQTRYILSVAYQCSVVVIDPLVPAVRPLPVLKRAIAIAPLRRPVIERVVSAQDPEAPIVPGSMVALIGTDLAGEQTLVQIGGVTVSPQAEATARRIQFVLPAGLRAGVQGIGITHQILLGEPPTPHIGVESSPAAFALSPQLGAVSRTVQANPPATLLTVNFEPPLARSQRAALLVSRGTSSEQVQIIPAAARSAPTDAEQTTVLTFALAADLARDPLVVRLLVDGAQSPPRDVA